MGDRKKKELIEKNLKTASGLGVILQKLLRNKLKKLHQTQKLDKLTSENSNKKTQELSDIESDQTGSFLDKLIRKMNKINKNEEQVDDGMRFFKNVGLSSEDRAREVESVKASSKENELIDFLETEEAEVEKETRKLNDQIAELVSQLRGFKQVG